MSKDTNDEVAELMVRFGCPLTFEELLEFDSDASTPGEELLALQRERDDLQWLTKITGLSESVPDERAIRTGYRPT